MHVVDGHARVEGNRCEDGDLGRGVEPIDIGRRIGFGKALGLRLGKHLVVRHIVFGHTGEHVVGRAVHDAHHGIDAVRDKRVLHRIDDRDAAAHARLERDLPVRLCGSSHNLFAVGGHERLVGCDHVLAGAQRFQHHVLGNGRAADELDDDVDRGIVHDVV